MIIIGSVQSSNLSLHCRYRRVWGGKPYLRQGEWELHQHCRVVQLQLQFWLLWRWMQLHRSAISPYLIHSSLDLSISLHLTTLLWGNFWFFCLLFIEFTYPLSDLPIYDVINVVDKLADSVSQVVYYIVCCSSLQTLMSVGMVWMNVMSMLTVPTPLVVTSVPALSDTVEMEPPAVSTSSIDHPFL